MDHGVWPFLTTLLYIDQTGDDAFLLENVPYFADPQMSRTFERNTAWTSSYGHELKDKKGEAYRGTVLEHILVQHLVQFYNVGEHNITRLESADWNDGLDMAFKRGESVAFMAFYGGNLLSIARLLERLARDKNISTIKVAKELLMLLDTMSHPIDYNDAKANTWEDKKIASVQPGDGTLTLSVALVGSYVAGKDSVRIREKIVKDNEFIMWSDVNADGMKIAEIMLAPFGLGRNYGVTMDTKDEFDPEGTIVRIQNKSLPVVYHPDCTYKLIVA
jgi:hypothetical protein